MAKATTATLHCNLACAARVSALLKDITIDDHAGVYRVTCPQCGILLEKELTYEARQKLREGGVRTVEEIVTSETVVLNDLNGFWEGILTGT